MAGEDSLKKRYVFKLVANVFGLVVGLATQAVIPRGLGPVAYGNFNFLTSFFQQVFGFLEMGTSTCFYTKLAQRQKDAGLVSFYLYFSGLISLLVLALAAGGQVFALAPRLWPGQEMHYVYLAAVWGILNWFSVSVLNRMVDAYGLTVSSEVARMAQKVFSLVLILALYFSGRLNLTSFFYFNFAAMLFLCLAIFWIVEKKGFPLIGNLGLSRDAARKYAAEFWQYSHPLFIGAVIGLFAGLLDRWLLQLFSGSVEQGFYGLSSMIGSACFVFTGAMIPLLWREFSISFEKKDLGLMSHLFNRYVPLLYSVAAALACFIAVQADKVILIMGGRQYAGALWPVIIMAFYPIHQTYGQLNSVVCMAAGETRLYSKIGVLFALIGIPVGYLLLAPADKFGLNGGATGLAVKMLLIQIVGVNVQLYYNCRLLKLDFLRYVRHQVSSVLLLLAFSLLALLGSESLSALAGRPIPGFLFSGLLYSLLIAAVFYLKPVLFGLERKDITSLIQFVTSKIVLSK